MKKLVWENEIYPGSGDGGPSLGLSLLFHRGLHPESQLLPSKPPTIFTPQQGYQNCPDITIFTFQIGPGQCFGQDQVEGDLGDQSGEEGQGGQGQGGQGPEPLSVFKLQISAQLE